MYEQFRTAGFYPAPSEPNSEDLTTPPSTPLPGGVDDVIPPPHLMQYGEAPKAHLKSGATQAAIIREVLDHAGHRVHTGHRFLDFGCSNGRVIRHFDDWAKQGEGWGVDVNSATVRWAQEHFSPPFDFAVSTTAPHLFFEDGYFDLILALSVFTHIDDLSVSWLMELRRVLKPGGYMFATFLDETACEFLDEHPERPLAARVAGSSTYQEFRTSQMKRVCLGRDRDTQVFYRRAYLIDLLRRYYEVASMREGAMAGFQVGFLLKKR